MVLRYAAKLSDANEYGAFWWGQSNSRDWGNRASLAEEARHLALLQGPGDQFRIERIEHLSEPDTEGDKDSESYIWVANAYNGSVPATLTGNDYWKGGIIQLIGQVYGRSGEETLRFGVARVISADVVADLGNVNRLRFHVQWISEDGWQRESVRNTELSMVSLDAGLGVVWWDNHCLRNGDTVRFKPHQGNSPDNLPTELTDDTTYYVVNATAYGFEISETLGGVKESWGDTRQVLCYRADCSNWMAYVHLEGQYKGYDNIRVLTPYVPEAPADDPSDANYPTGYPSGSPSLAGYQWPSNITSYEDAGLFLDYAWGEGVEGFGYKRQGVSFTSGNVTALASEAVALEPSILCEGYLLVDGGKYKARIESNTDTEITVKAGSWVGGVACPDGTFDIEAYVDHPLNNRHHFVGEGFRYPSSEQQPGGYSVAQPGTTYNRPCGRMTPTFNARGEQVVKVDERAESVYDAYGSGSEAMLKSSADWQLRVQPHLIASVTGISTTSEDRLRVGCRLKFGTSNTIYRLERYTITSDSSSASVAEIQISAEDISALSIANDWPADTDAVKVLDDQDTGADVGTLDTSTSKVVLRISRYANAVEQSVSGRRLDFNKWLAEGNYCSVLAWGQGSGENINGRYRVRAVDRGRQAPVTFELGSVKTGPESGFGDASVAGNPSEEVRLTAHGFLSGQRIVIECSSKISGNQSWISGQEVVVIKKDADKFLCYIGPTDPDFPMKVGQPPIQFTLDPSGSSEDATFKTHPTNNGVIVKRPFKSEANIDRAILKNQQDAVGFAVTDKDGVATGGALPTGLSSTENYLVDTYTRVSTAFAYDGSIIPASPWGIDGGFESEDCDYEFFYLKTASTSSQDVTASDIGSGTVLCEDTGSFVDLETTTYGGGGVNLGVIPTAKDKLAYFLGDAGSLVMRVQDGRYERLGASVEFAWRLSQYIGKRVNLIMSQCNSAGLWYANTDNFFGYAGKLGWWDRWLDFAKTRPVGMWSRIVRLINTIAPAALLAEGSAKKLKALCGVGFQGEADSIERAGREQYKETLGAFVEGVRGELQKAGMSPYPEDAEIPFCHAKLPTVPWSVDGDPYGIGETLSGDSLQLVNRAIQELVAEMRFMATIETQDHPKMVAEFPSDVFAPQTDPLHYNAKGFIENGFEAAEKLAPMIDTAASFEVGDDAVEICNLALSNIGEGATITSLDASVDDSLEARLARQFYQESRDSVLSMHPWNFALKREELVPWHYYADLKETPNLSPTYSPNEQWPYAYKVPDDLIHALAVLERDAGGDYVGTGASAGVVQRPPLVGQSTHSSYTPQPFTVETVDGGGRLVLTRLAPPAIMRYTSRVSDTNRYSGLFKVAFSWHLASLLAGGLLKGEKGAELSKYCMSRLSVEIGKAREQDARQRSTDIEPVNKYTNTR